MNLNYSLTFIPLLLIVFFSILLSTMAGRRGFSRVAWAFIGLLPGINIVGLILLALKPKLADGN